MKITKYLILSIVTILTMTLTSCKKEEDGDISTTAILKVNVTVEGYGAIAGVNVQLTESISDEDVQEKVTNSNGEVTFTNILPGTYKVYGDYIIGNPNDSNYEEHTGYSNSFQLIEGQTKTMSLVLD